MNNPEIIFLNKNQKVEEIDFGIVPVGQTKTLDLIAKNIGSVEVTALVFEINHPDVKIIQSPRELKPRQEEHLIFEYTPEYQLDKGLNIKLKVRGIYKV